MPRVKEKPIMRVIFPISPEKFISSDDETDGLRKGETEQNEVSLLETVQKSGSQQRSESGKTGAEKNPIPGPSSKDSNLKRNNDRAKKETQGAKQKKISTFTQTDSKKIRKQDMSGECDKCHRGYENIFNHSKKRHNNELKKCTTSGCKIYFDSAQKRSEHEQRVHRVRKKFRCQHCNYSTENKYNLNGHVRRKHLLEKKIKCRQLNCGSMFDFEADLKNHIKMAHSMIRCPKCGGEVNQNAMYNHNRYGRCVLF